MSLEPRTSVVLSGRCAYAAYEVGVLKALLDGASSSTGHRPLEIDLFCGSSAGALNAAVLIANDTNGLRGAIDVAERMWLERIAEDSKRCGNGVYRVRGFLFDLLDPACLLQNPRGMAAAATEDAALFLQQGAAFGAGFLRSGRGLLNRIAYTLDLSGYVSTRPLEATLREFVPMEGLKRSSRALRLVATNLDSGEPTVFTTLDIERHGYGPLLATTALPAFFPPARVGGSEFIDGSTLASTPLLPAITETEDLHVIYQDPDVASIELDRLRNTVDVIDKAVAVHFAYAMNQDLEYAKSVNLALDLAENPEAAHGLDTAELRSVVRTLDRLKRRIARGRPYRPLTVHRYHPREELGHSLGLVNLTKERIHALIERGYYDASHHDCFDSECLVPGGGPGLGSVRRTALGPRAAGPTATRRTAS